MMTPASDASVPMTITVDREIQMYNPATQAYETHMVPKVIANPALQCESDVHPSVGIGSLFFFLLLTAVVTWFFRGFVKS